MTNDFLKKSKMVPLRDRCSFGRFPWLISQSFSVIYVAGEHRLYLGRNCRLTESPAHGRRRKREGPASSKGLNSQRGFGPAVAARRKSRSRSTGFHGSSPCKCQRLSTLWWDRLPPSSPPQEQGPRRRPSTERQPTSQLVNWLFPRRGRPPGAESCTHLCEEPQRSRGLALDVAEVEVGHPGSGVRVHRTEIVSGRRTGPSRVPWRDRRPLVPARRPARGAPRRVCRPHRSRPSCSTRTAG